MSFVRPKEIGMYLGTRGSSRAKTGSGVVERRGRDGGSSRALEKDTAFRSPPCVSGGSIDRYKPGAHLRSSVAVKSRDGGRSFGTGLEGF